MHAEADVDAAAELDVVRVAASDVETVRIRESIGVAIRRAEQHPDLGAVGDRDPAHHEVMAQDEPLEELERRVEPQELLDGGGGRDLTRDQPCPLGRIPRERCDTVSKRVDRRLVPGVEQEDRHRRDLVIGQTAAVDLDLAERRDHARGRAQPAFRDEVEGVATERAGGGVRLDGEVTGRRELVHLDHRVGPGQEHRTVRSRHAEQIRDHGDRERLGELAEEVERLALHQRIEQLRRDLLDRRTHVLDGAGREGPRDQRPQAGVVGRLEIEQRVALRRPELAPLGVALGLTECRPGRHRLGNAHEPAVAQQAMNVGESRYEPHAGGFVVEGGRGGPQLVQRRVGIG